MPPKIKFTRQEILAAALDLVRAQGADALTARALAGKLRCSVRPIFGQFSGMEELRAAVMEAADGLYQSYLQVDMASGQYPPYKASGMAYIRFARQEPELFKLLFMRSRAGEANQDDTASLEPILHIIMENLGISHQEALLLHMEMWVYVHGVAAMVATNYLNWDMELVSRSLTDVYRGLCHRFTGKE